MHYDSEIGMFLSGTCWYFSGGYNIKTGPGCSIELMKFDMGGSAAVLGSAKAIAQIKPAGVEASHYQDIIWFSFQVKQLE